jgi:Uma2 family endonuclease
MHGLASLLPAQGNWSEADYLWLTAHTNRLVEYRDGQLEILPTPTDRHQAIVLYLYAIFLAWVHPPSWQSPRRAVALTTCACPIS